MAKILKFIALHRSFIVFGQNDIECLQVFFKKHADLELDVYDLRPVLARIPIERGDITAKLYLAAEIVGMNIAHYEAYNPKDDAELLLVLVKTVDKFSSQYKLIYRDSLAFHKNCVMPLLQQIEDIKKLQTTMKLSQAEMSKCMALLEKALQPKDTEQQLKVPTEMLLAKGKGKKKNKKGKITTKNRQQ